MEKKRVRRLSWRPCELAARQDTKNSKQMKFLVSWVRATLLSRDIIELPNHGLRSFAFDVTKQVESRPYEVHVADFDAANVEYR